MSADPSRASAPNPAFEALVSCFPLLPADSPACWPGAGLRVGVAFSGGADSMALLHAAAARWPGRVDALHVHHGLQAAADDFVQVCQSACDALAVPLRVIHVDARHAPGESPEDAARRARYAALAEAALAAGLAGVLLGQHADDQVETLLLALSRGAGLPGLASMPAHFERHGMRFDRPLIHTPAQCLRAWLQAAGIAYVDDPTNLDERYTRNRIRARLLPALAEVFPQFRETFARSAGHAAQAQALLAEIAVQDLAEVGSPPVIVRLQALSAARRANVLRHWLLSVQASASAAQLAQLQSQILACVTRGHRIELKVGAGQVVRDGAVLRYVPPDGRKAVPS